MRNTAKITTAVLATGALTLGLAACGSEDGSGTADADGPLIVAASPTPHADILNYVKDNLAKKEGLDLEVKEFTDYVQPNIATQDGSVGANFFQHKPYLDDFNKKNGTDLVWVNDVHLEPLGLYSKKVKNADELADGATLALPNDTTNEGRALKLLDAHGIIELKADAGLDATPADIAENPRNLKFKEIEAAQLPRSLADVDAAVINGNYAVEAGLSPESDALVSETAKGNPYANGLVVKKGQEDDPRVKKLAKLLNSDEVRKYLDDTFDGAVESAF
ncbi:MetQ/NlpA family ABC transporter substrate-binding protein [Streptomyces sp. KLOTTS4A1]|uniref:MetQ/NlpA family ABC transporter substrate-binding protein n=1 Tax=Streptomyces sp. KLOTTS4A1 TaxID=3390996 RepID=UPI0039F4EBE5